MEMGKKRDELRSDFERRDEVERDPLFWEDPVAKVGGRIGDCSGKSTDNGDSSAAVEEISCGDKSLEGESSAQRLERQTREMMAEVEEELRQEGILPPTDLYGGEPVYEPTRYPGDMEGEFDEVDGELGLEEDLAALEPAGAGDACGAVAADVEPEEEKPVVGRPRVLDDIKKAEFCAFLRAGLSRRQASVEVGCHYSSVTREMKRDGQFAEDVSFAERKGYVRPLLQIIKASQNSWRAAAWLIQNHRPSNALSREERMDKDREVLQALDEIDGLMSDMG